MKEEKIRERLEEITKELVKIQGKKYKTNIIEQNKEYRELCTKQGLLEAEKTNLLNLIKNIYAGRK